MLALVSFLHGCTGTETRSEREARADLAAVSGRYRPGDAKPELPALGESSGIDVYLQFAMLNSPRIEAAYYDWTAGVERITQARSKPDPRLTFKLDISSMAASAAAGLMTDLPGPGKLEAAADVSAAESSALYSAFEAEILRTAFAVKSAYFRLKFLEDKLGVLRENLGLQADLEVLARQQNAAGRATLRDVLQAQIEQERLKTGIENLEGSRSALRAELKAALGLGPRDPDPPVPAKFTSSDATPNRDAILEIALKRNPSIRLMTAELGRAGAMLDAARRAQVPDASIGLEAGLGAGGFMASPAIGVSLPIWIDKIKAQIAAAQAGKRAAEARLSGEQAQVAAELAAMLFLNSESVRNMKLLEEKLLPMGRQSLEAARAGYAGGKSGFLDVIEGYRQLLGFNIALIEARAQRELAIASLSLLIAGVQPQGSPANAAAGEPGGRK